MPGVTILALEILLDSDTVPANWIRAAYSSCPREGEEEEEEGGGLGGAAGAARSAVPRCARSVVARAAVAVRDRPNSRALALRGCEETAVRQGWVDWSNVLCLRNRQGKIV